MKILVADDADYMRKILSREITRLGHEVIEAENGKEAVIKSKKEKPDVIFMDLIMPDMDGFSVIKQIAGENKGRVIICTAMWDKIHIMEAIEAGASDYMIKPVDGARLEEVLRQADCSLHAGCDDI